LTLRSSLHSAAKKAKDEAAAANTRAQQADDAHATVERRHREAEERLKRASDDLLENRRLLAEAKAALQTNVGDLAVERNKLQNDLAVARKEAKDRRAAQVRPVGTPGHTHTPRTRHSHLPLSIDARSGWQTRRRPPVGG